MKRSLAIAVSTLLLGAADATKLDADRIQGTWVDRSSPGRETWVFRGDRFTHTRAAYVGEIVVGRPGREGRTPCTVPGCRVSATFRLVGTKLPRVIVLVCERPITGARTETTYELPDDDTFVFQEGWGFGRRALRTFQRDKTAR